MTPSKQIYLIINNYAGHQKGQRAAEFLVPYLQIKGCQVDFTYTQYPGHATELSSKAASAGYDLVVAVGGDGTMNEVAQGLIGTKTALGIIPMGSGNGLARDSGIPMKLIKAGKTLLDGIDVQIDVCRMNNQQFLCTSGIGFDAMIADKMSKSSSRGFLKYIQLVIQESIFYQPVDISMKIDDKWIEEPVFLVTFANASQFGNNAYIAPAASMTDGLIDVVVVKKFSKFWMPVFALALFSKLIPKLPFVDCYKAKRIEIKQANTPYLHFDGEPGQLRIPAVIELDPERITVRCGK